MSDHPSSTSRDTPAATPHISHFTLHATALIIGGTAAYGLDLSPYDPVDAPINIETPFGPSPRISFLKSPGNQPPIAFCSRHGHETLKRSAAFLNHKAILWAAKLLQTQVIFSWNGTGAIALDLEVGDLVVPNDLLDFTHSRITSFNDADLTPTAGSVFSPQARHAILKTADRQGIVVYNHGAYVCTEGPRLESVSEITLYHAAGADVVGMTLSPEVFLAQLGMAYASLCYITNYASGRAGRRQQRRQFGAEVATTCLPILLHAASLWQTANLQPST